MTILNLSSLGSLTEVAVLSLGCGLKFEGNVNYSRSFFGFNLTPGEGLIHKFHLANQYRIIDFKNLYSILHDVVNPPEFITNFNPTINNPSVPRSLSDASSRFLLYLNFAIYRLSTPFAHILPGDSDYHCEAISVLSGSLSRLESVSDSDSENFELINVFMTIGDYAKILSHQQLVKDLRAQISRQCHSGASDSTDSPESSPPESWLQSTEPCCETPDGEEENTKPKPSKPVKPNTDISSTDDGDSDLDSTITNGTNSSSAATAAPGGSDAGLDTPPGHNLTLAPPLPKAGDQQEPVHSSEPSGGSPPSAQLRSSTASLQSPGHRAPGSPPAGGLAPTGTSPEGLPPTGSAGVVQPNADAAAAAAAAAAERIAQGGIGKGGGGTIQIREAPKGGCCCGGDSSDDGSTRAGNACDCKYCGCSEIESRILKQEAVDLDETRKKKKAEIQEESKVPANHKFCLERARESCTCRCCKCCLDYLKVNPNRITRCGIAITFIMLVVLVSSSAYEVFVTDSYLDYQLHTLGTDWVMALVNWAYVWLVILSLGVSVVCLGSSQNEINYRRQDVIEEKNCKDPFNRGEGMTATFSKCVLGSSLFTMDIFSGMFIGAFLHLPTSALLVALAIIIPLSLIVYYLTECHPARCCVFTVSAA